MSKSGSSFLKTSLWMNLRIYFLLPDTNYDLFITIEPPTKFNDYKTLAAWTDFFITSVLWVYIDDFFIITKNSNYYSHLWGKWRHFSSPQKGFFPYINQFKSNSPVLGMSGGSISTPIWGWPFPNYFNLNPLWIC